MGIRTILLRASLLTVRSEIRYTWSQLKAHPLTTVFVPVYEALLDDWDIVNDKELALNDALADAQARIDACDDDLDDFASRTSKAVLILTKDNRTHPLYKVLFGESSVSEFQRPRLGAELAAMAVWPPSLKGSGHPSLQALGAELEPKIKEADDAVKLRAAVLQQKKDFREVGDRMKFIEKVNGVRKVTYGELAKMRHEHAGLPVDFADRFFRHDESRNERAKPEDVVTLASIDAAIAGLKAQLAEQEKHRSEFLANEEAAAKAAAKLAADKAALAEIEKAAAEMLQKAAALRAEIVAQSSS